MIGIDALGLASKHWNINETVKVWPQGFAVGCFDGDDVFGDCVPNLRKLLDTGRVPAARIHAHWSDSHKIADVGVLQKRLPKYEKLAKQYPGVKFYVSHSCEYNEKNKVEIQKRVNLVANLCPSCQVVQSPMGGSPTIPGFMLESHGTNAKADGGIVSADGNPLFDLDSEKWANRTKGSVIQFSWGMRCNGLESNVHPPRPQRTAFPDAKYLRSLARILLPKGPVPTPTFTTKVIPIIDPLGMKSHGEDMPGDQSRDNKPCLFLKKQTPTVDIVTFQGVKIASLGYFGTFPGGRFRYYSGWKGGSNLYGYEIAEKAKALSGYEWTWVRQGSTYYGPIHFAFRCGFFH